MTTRFSAGTARASVETYAAQVGAQALGLAAGILIARLLGPSGKGLCTWLMLWPALVVVVGRLGLDAAAVFFGRTEPESRGSLRAMLAPVAGIAGTALAVLFLAGVSMGRPSAGIHAPALLAVAMLAGPVGLYVALVQGFLLGCDRVRQSNALALAVPAVHTAVLSLAWAWRPEAVNAQLAIGSWVAAWAAAGIAAHVAVHRAAPVSQPLDRRLLRRTLAYGLRVHVGGLAAHLNGRLTHFLIGAFAGAAALGIYSVALSAAEVLAYFAVAESIVLFPAASALPGAARWGFVRRRSAIALALFGGASLVSIVAIDPAVRLLFGTEFAPAATVFLFLLPGMAAHSVNLLAGSGLRAAGEPIEPTRAAWLGLGTGLALAPLVLPRWGVHGAAMLFSAAQVVSCAYLVAAARRSERRAATPVVALAAAGHDSSAVILRARGG